MVEKYPSGMIAGLAMFLSKNSSQISKCLNARSKFRFQLGGIWIIRNWADSLNFHWFGTTWFSLWNHDVIIWTLGHTKCFPAWRQIWKTNAPYKVMCFSSLLAQHTCLTHQNLQRSGYVLDVFCETNARKSNSFASALVCHWSIMTIAF